MFAAVAMAGAASAQAPVLKPGLEGLGFLVGHWSTATPGKVADTGGRSAGEVSFTPEVGGAVLLRRDHVRLYDAAGEPAGGFGIMMMIYPEAGGIHADYADGDHVIHYTSAAIVAGKSVSFTSATLPGVPVFKLDYTVVTPTKLAISFAMVPPGSTEFHPIATGTMTKER